MCRWFEVNIDFATVPSVAPVITRSWEGHSDDQKQDSPRSEYRCRICLRFAARRSRADLQVKAIDDHLAVSTEDDLHLAGCWVSANGWPPYEVSTATEN